MRVRGRRVAVGLASAGMIASGLAAPAKLVAQTTTTAPAPAEEAVPPGTITVPAEPPPAAFVPDPAPTAPEGVQNESRPPPTTRREDSREREREHRRQRERAGQRERARERDRERERARSGDDGEQLDPALRDALPAIGPMNVPSFFIETFAVPPFLLPIYQAAGIEYGVRWEVLAAINEIETDYGRNLNVSTAGAIGWMQFLPSTWEQYGVDASGDGRKDPYNPVDAIFAAARYLKAAGAGRDLPRAIFAYNHANWYVISVLERAQLLAALPTDLVGALSGLAHGRPPVIGRARLVGARARRGRTLSLATRSQAAVVAVSDGEIVRIGSSPRLGSFVRLRDVYGNTYTYGGLGRLARRYPVLDASARQAAARTPDRDAAPTTPATAGAQRPGAASGPTAPAAAPAPGSAAVRPALVQDPAAAAAVAPGRSGPAAAIARGAATGPAVAASPHDSQQLARGGRDPGRATPARREPGLPAAPAAAGPRTGAPAPSAAPAPLGNRLQVPALARLDRASAAWSARRAARRSADAKRQRAPEQLTAHDQRLLGDVAGRHVRYRPLREGSRVIAGTLLARAGAAPSTSRGGRLRLEIRPAGRGAPRIDPRPIVAGWRLLRASQPTVAADPSIGQILLLGKRALEQRVLDDRRIKIYRCGRDDIRAGRIDRRVLATLELLASSGLHPTVSSLDCAHGRRTSSGRVSQHASGNAVDISAINGVPIRGNQGEGSITETAIARLLSLQGTVKPHQIISLMTFDGADNTLSMADHDDHIHVGFKPEHNPRSLAARQFDGVLEPRQWGALMRRLSRIDNPEVLSTPPRSAGKSPMKPR